MAHPSPPLRRVGVFDFGVGVGFGFRSSSRVCLLILQPTRRGEPSPHTDKTGSCSRPVVHFPHRSKTNPSHPSQTQRGMGHPQDLRLNFEVNYWSGIVLTEAPSIVKTTDARREGCATRPIANSYTYDSFGQLTASTGSITNRFQYTRANSTLKAVCITTAPDTTIHRLVGF